MVRELVQYIPISLAILPIFNESDPDLATCSEYDFRSCPTARSAAGLDVHSAFGVMPGCRLFEDWKFSIRIVSLLA
jgi:hypothetical protein